MYDLVLALRSDDPLDVDKDELMIKFCKAHNTLCELINATQFLSHFLGDETEDDDPLVIGIIQDDDDTEMPGV